MDRQLLLGETRPRLRSGQVGKEELEQSRVAQFRRFRGWLFEPGGQGAPTRVRDLEDAPASTFVLAVFGREPELRQPRRHRVEQRVRERPEVAERRPDVALELVRRRRAFSGEQAEDEVGRRRESVA